MTSIYLDNSTTSRPSDNALSAMMPYFADLWGSPYSPHKRGQRLATVLEDSYRAVYALLGAAEEDLVIFTASGAEAVNQAILSGYMDRTLEQGKNQFIASAVDEAPALMALAHLEKMECVPKLANVDARGQVTPDVLGDLLTPRTAMVSLSWGNGLTGVIQPVVEIATLCRERGILFHLDATHILGRCFFDLAEIGADMISFNGEQLHAPQGTGGLYVRKGTPCSALIAGGLEQGGYRAGGVNMPAVAGLGTAAKEAKECLDFVSMEVARLRNRLEDSIKIGFPDATVFFKEQDRLPHCTAIGFPGVANEALLYLLNRQGVYASIGGGSFQQLALILAAAGIAEPLAHSAVSFSLSRETTEEEVDRAATIVVDAVKQLAKVSEKLSQGEV